MNSTDLLVWGVVAHLVADWLLQNEWQATNKTNLRHPAAWVYCGIHMLALLFVFPEGWACGIAAAHLLIDTRRPLQWWRRVIRQTTDSQNPLSLHVAIWGDQVLHIAIIAVVACMDEG
jgi:hypothetical protein